MSPVAERLKGILEELPTSDRAGLAHFLIRSLDSDDSDAEGVDAGPDESLDDTLDRRLTEYLNGQVVGVSLTEVIAELKAAHREAS